MQETIAKCMSDFKQKEWKWFCASIAVGFVCHSSVFYNTLIFHDDAYLRFFISDETPMQNGRWFFSYLVSFFNAISGTEGIPLLLGMLTLCFIAGSWLVAVKLFDMEDNISRIISLIFFNVLPVTVSNFGYFTTCIYNFIGCFVCILGVAFICRSGKILSIKYFIGCCLIATGIGEYQCMLCVAATFIIICFSMEIYKSSLQENIKIIDYFFRTGIKYLLSLFFSLAIYFLVLQISLWRTGVELTSYAGIDTYGIVSLKEYLVRIGLAYRKFFVSDNPSNYCLFPFKNTIWHNLFYIGLCVLIVRSVILLIKNKKWGGSIAYIISVFLIPLAIESMFVLYDSNRVHSLHTYSYVGFFIWCLLLVKMAPFNIKRIQSVVYIYLLILGVLYFRYDNLCYFQMQIMQERAKSYFIELKTRIQSTENYDSNFPILFINDREKNIPEMLSTISSSDNISTNPYTGFDIPNGYAWDKFMTAWTGWSPNRTNIIEPEWEEMIRNMQTYPDYGSIAVIDDVVIVKFN